MTAIPRQKVRVDLYSDVGLLDPAQISECRDFGANIPDF